MTEQILRVAVFASGGGSNFQSLVDHAAESPNVEVSLCISNKKDAGVLARAADAGIPTLVLSPSDFSDPNDYIRELLQHLVAHDVNMIALAGYLKMIPTEVIGAYRNRILNIHPSLLPSFGGKGMYGKRVHEAVIKSGTQWSGATVHVVDEEYDTGPIVIQEPVPVDQNDTPESLAARVLKVEHRLYPRALQLFADNKVRVTGNRVIILDS